jgi:acetyl esterase/lipase
VNWLFLVLAAGGAVGVANALWPVHRPWWCKQSSFQLGWSPNELPWHVLAGTVVVTAVLLALGALDGWPGAAGLVLVAASVVGLVVLGAAHHRAARAVAPFGVDLRAAFPGGGVRSDLGPVRFPLAWRLVPWLVAFVRPGAERIGGIEYARVGGRRLALDLYRPADRRPGCPVLVEVHGGGWVLGDRRFDARPLMARLAADGWVCVSIDYRLSRRATWPDHIVDVKTALAWVRAHVAEYGGDPDLVVLTGGSSGGHLAALATLDEAGGAPVYAAAYGQPAAIAACVPLYGVYDFDNRLGLRTRVELRLFLERPVVKVPKESAPEVYALATPLGRVVEGAPPFLVVQGTSDNLVLPAESRAFVERLRAVSRAPVLYLEVPRGAHWFDAVPSLRTASTVAAIEAFLEAVRAARAAR